MHTFCSFSFGCRVNEAEKVALDRELLSLGFVWDTVNPDFYIINSCAVTGKAEREVRQHVYQIRRKFPKTTIIITGCAATRWICTKATPKEVNYVIPNTQKLFIPKLLDQWVYRHPERSDRVPPKALAVAQGSQWDSSPDFVGFRMTAKHFVYYDKFLSSGRLMVKIQDGCDRFCSYCIVPFVRGKPKSRRINNIIAEINLSTQRSHSRSHLESSKNNIDSRFRGNDRNESAIHEVILTAINTACFGKDTGETLIELIDAILKNTSTPKISFGSIHPWSITDEFLAYYQTIMSTNRFIPFFHIPIQSGSDTILSLMNRGYTANEMLKKLNKIKEINPQAVIGTDIIVGFPGEGEREFEQTVEFLKEAPIDKIHVFRFSHRPGTIVENVIKTLGEPTPKMKKNRVKILLALTT